jgi:ribosomal protein S18 acetylase RimI-like enzyme
MTKNLESGSTVKDFLQSTRITPVKRSENLPFSFLTFCFFKNSERGKALVFGNSRLLTSLILIPYILAMEVLHLKGKRYFVKFKKHIVGVFILREKPEVLYISSLAVAPNYRRFGVGTRILKYAERAAGRMGKKWLELSVLKINTPARRLYEKTGFVKEKEKRLGFILRKEIQYS